MPLRSLFLADKDRAHFKERGLKPPEVPVHILPILIAIMDLPDAQILGGNIAFDTITSIKEFGLLFGLFVDLL